MDTTLMFQKIGEFISAVFVAFLSYFAPLSAIVHLVLFTFLMDIIWGWQADRKLNKAKFEPGIVWRKSMPRILLSLTLLFIAFMVDKETSQDLVSTYKIVGGIICGLLAISILKNGYIVTAWGALKVLDDWARKEVKEKTGINLEDVDV